VHVLCGPCALVQELREVRVRQAALMKAIAEKNRTAIMTPKHTHRPPTLRSSGGIGGALGSGGFGALLLSPSRSALRASGAATSITGSPFFPAPATAGTLGPNSSGGVRRNQVAPFTPVPAASSLSPPPSRLPPLPPLPQTQSGDRRNDVFLSTISSSSSSSSSSFTIEVVPAAGSSKKQARAVEVNAGSSRMATGSAELFGAFRIPPLPFLAIDTYEEGVPFPPTPGRLGMTLDAGVVLPTIDSAAAASASETAAVAAATTSSDAFEPPLPPPPRFTDID
jgi:hypothetical protein